MYIVTAYKGGNRNDHSYNLGVFKNKKTAIIIANNHCEYRGGKYACVVEECVLNHFDNEDDLYTKEIYRAKSTKD